MSAHAFPKGGHRLSRLTLLVTLLLVPLCGQRILAQDNRVSTTDVNSVSIERETETRCVPVGVVEDDIWEQQHSGVSTSLRGICAVDENCCWASGAKGTVIRTTDAGKTWITVGPQGAEAADFRDIQAWDQSTAIIMSAGDVDRLYRTEDGGRSWTVVYEHPDPAAFFDGMSFDATGKRGWLMGDPILGKVFLLTTSDAGRTWQRFPPERTPSLPDGIAAFAASGTHLTCPDEESVVIGLGGEEASSSETALATVLITKNAGQEWQNVSVPIRTGKSAGLFSVTASRGNSQRLIAVGGDYLKLEQATDNAAISDDAGRSWRLPRISSPGGFRSAVVSVMSDEGSSLLISTGPSGTDLSTDEGESWTPASRDGFHTISFVSKSIGWASGSDGRIARWRSAN